MDLEEPDKMKKRRQEYRSESESRSVLSDSLRPHGYSRPECWSGQPFPSPGIKLRSAPLQADSLPAEPPGKPYSAKATTIFAYLISFKFHSSGLLLVFSKTFLKILHYWFSLFGKCKDEFHCSEQLLLFQIGDLL